MKGSDEVLIVTGTPHIHNFTTTSRMMWTVSLWLTPSALWGCYLFGIGAVRILLTAVISAVVTEGVIGIIRKEFTLQDGSAFLSGLLIGMLMPPTVPLFIPLLASLFAMVVVKWSFGGLGRNWMNPALAGWAFVSLSFPQQMKVWLFPSVIKGVDAVTRSTPLTLVKQKTFLEGLQGFAPMDILATVGFPRSLNDGMWTDWINGKVLETLGIVLPPGYMDLFWGFIPGAIGETSSFLLLLGTVALIGKGILPWQVPFSLFSVFGVLVFLLGPGDLLFHLFTGGVLLGSFYMATDLVTSPQTKQAQLLYGAGVGLFTFLIRAYGGAAEGIGFAILFMNVFVPVLNRFFAPPCTRKG